MWRRQLVWAHRNGQNDLCDRRVRKNRQQVVDGPFDGHAVDHLPYLVGGVVHQATGRIAPQRVALELGQQGHRRRTRADDGRLAAALAAAARDAEAVHAVEKANKQHGQQRQRRARQRLDDPDKAGSQGKVGHRVEAISAGHPHQQHQIFPALRIAPQALIGLEGELEHQYAEGEKTDMEHQVQKLNVAAQQRGKKEEKIAGKDQQHVGCQDDPPAETG